jgi:flotillin
MLVALIVIVVLVALVAAAIFFAWKVAEPNEAVIVSGLGARGDEEGGLGFKIVVGRGTLVLPGLQTARRLSLAVQKSDLSVRCVTTQGVPVTLHGVVVYKIGDSMSEIANAARRFLEKEREMDSNVHEVFTGHIRAIVGTVTVEEIIREREKLASKTREGAGGEMAKLGLVIDSLQFQEVEDPTGYIENVAKPHQAKVRAEARMAEADRDREATQREQEAAAIKARAVSESEIEQAKRRANADRAKAEASQAGPLMHAQALQAVVGEETRVAELEAERAEMKLKTQVVRPAEAGRDARIATAEAEKREVELRAAATAEKVKIEAAARAEERQVLAAAEQEALERIGEGEAKATLVKGDAQASAVKAVGLAEADAIKARAQALAENSEAVINVKVAEVLPEIVSAAAESFKGIDHLVVLNGAEGMKGMLGQVMGAGVAGVSMFRDLFAADGSASTNGGERGGRLDGGEPAASEERAHEEVRPAAR